MPRPRSTPLGAFSVSLAVKAPEASCALIVLAVVAAPLLSACENRVTSTQQCLGNGSTTSTYTNYTFEVDDGPAVDVAGNCHVVLDHCTIHAPDGVRAAESAVVTIIGGTLVARRAAVVASGNAKVAFRGTSVTGTVMRSGSAAVTGLAPR